VQWFQALPWLVSALLGLGHEVWQKVIRSEWWRDTLSISSGKGFFDGPQFNRNVGGDREGMSIWCLVVMRWEV
jgi:hypothetical protein